jgi:hypothetical protein
MFKEKLKIKKKTDAHLKSTITIKQNALLPICSGKCSHLPKLFGKSPKLKRLQEFFGLLPPHYGKC